jgi:hypothetical protein
MKKTNISMTINYEIANTTDSINDAIAREIVEIGILENCAKSKRDQLKAFIRENREAMNVEEIAATLRANKFTKQDIHRAFESFGIVRRPQKKSGASQDIQKKAQAEFAALSKKYSKAELSAIARRIYSLALGK